MMKTKALTIVAALVFAASSLFAATSDKACCATKNGKMQCDQIYAKLNLTPDQKAKLDAYQAQCEKEGCTKQSMDKFLRQAKHVLSKDQYAQLKSACEKMQASEKGKS